MAEEEVLHEVGRYIADDGFEHIQLSDGREVWEDEKHNPWVKDIDGFTYPGGLEPDHSLTDDQLAVARAKERTMGFVVRFAGLALLIMIVLLVAFIITAP